MSTKVSLDSVMGYRGATVTLIEQRNPFWWLIIEVGAVCLLASWDSRTVVETMTNLTDIAFLCACDRYNSLFQSPTSAVYFL